MTPSEIRAARTAYPLSTAELAARMGVAYDTIRNWEHGRRTPDAPTMRALEVMFGLRTSPPGTWACQSGPLPCACRCHAIKAARRPGDRGPLKNQWRTEDIAYLRRALARGDTHDEIGEHLGRSRRACARMANDLGISSRAGWHSEAEAARLLGVDHRWVRRWRESGAIPAKRYSGHGRGVDPRWWRISADSLEAFIRLHAGRDLDPAGIRDPALRARAEVAAAVNRRGTGSEAAG